MQVCITTLKQIAEKPLQWHHSLYYRKISTIFNKVNKLSMTLRNQPPTQATVARYLPCHCLFRSTNQCSLFISIPLLCAYNFNFRGIHVSPVYEMAGHNKWSKIKRPKAAADLERSKKIGKICSEIISAVRQGGDNPETNLHLANALSRAKSIGIPKSTVSNALISATRQSNHQLSESVLYEARSSSGFSLLIEVLTDNKKRTRPEIRSILSKHGGAFGDTGSALFKFDFKGVVMVTKRSVPHGCDPLELGIQIGAEDVLKGEDEGSRECYQFICDAKDLRSVTEAAKNKGLDVTLCATSYIPNSTVNISSEVMQDAQELLNALHSHAEVMRIYTNFTEDKND